MNTKNIEGLTFPELIPGILVRRYKRFMADVRLENGTMVTAHCPNSGTMTACCDPGRQVYLSYHDNLRRKLKYTWELIDMPTSLVGINTLAPNRLIFHALKQGIIPELAGYGEIFREVRVGKNSRLDLLLKDRDAHCYVEIKNCTLVTDGIACFPDAVTARGLKHLMELEQLADAGCRCVMFYLIQRTDAIRFMPADHIDPAYGKALRRVVSNGIEILVYDVCIDLESIRLNQRIPCEL